jgi:hypothetical protein
LRSRFSRLGLPNVPSSMILRLGWRLVCLRHREGRAMWHASTSPKS